MSSYHISCTTCQARLKVKDESAVGLILSCPKCGSMVMVTAPGEQQEQAAAVSVDAKQEGFESEVTRETLPPQGPPNVRDSMQETVDASFDLPAELLAAPAGETAPPPTPPGSGSADLQETAIDFDAADMVAGDATHAEPATSREASDRLADEVGASAPRPDQWISKETRQMRQWLVAGAAMVFGVIAALGLVIFLLSQQAKQPPVAKGAGQSQEDGGSATTSPHTTLPDSQLETDPGDIAASLPTIPENPQVGVDRLDLPPALPPIANPNNDPAKAEGPDGDPQAIGDPPKQVAPNEGPNNTKPDTAGPLVGPPLPPTGPDPLAPPDLKPAGAELLSPLPPNPIEGAATDLLSDDKFDALESMIEAAASPTIPAGPADPDRETLYNRLKGALDPPRRPAGIHIDAPQQLKITLPRVESADVPLNDFLKVLMDVSTVPVTLDPNVVIYGGISPATKVTCRMNDASIETLLKATVKPLGLDLVVGSRHARLVVANRDKLVSFGFPAGDLAENNEQRQWLMATVRKVVAPGTWAPAGAGKIVWADDKTLSVEQSRQGLYETMHFLATLRVARKLPLQSKLSAERVATGARRTRAIPKLTKLTTVNFRNPAPLEVVLEKLSEQTAVQFVIDWEAIEAKGWNRRTEATLQTDQESLAAALRLLLTPMELDYLVLDSNIISITTREAMDARRELAVHPVPDLVPKGNDIDLAIEDVRKALGDGLFTDNPTNALAFDSVSRSMIARLSQPDQRRLQQLIDSMRIQE